MMDALFQAGTDQALDDRIRRPDPFKPEEPKLGVGQLLAAPFQGVSSGSTKSAAFAAEVLGAFGTTLAATGTGGAAGMFGGQAEEERKQAEAARNKVLRGEDMFTNPAGDMLRQAAKDVLPDPQSTHAAAGAIASVAEFATQAVGYAALAGPVAGAALLGADVGTAEADKLRLQGVDPRTRAAAGAVAGLTAGVSVALPVAGTTLARTTGLVAAGGPGGFITQNAAERAILRAGGYDKIASTYDPLDPVGLALSTIVPAGFGALGLRANQRAAARQAAAPLPDLDVSARVKLKFDDARLDAYAVTAAQREGIPAEALLAIKNAGERSNSTQTSPAGARGVMQFMPKTWEAYGRGGDITDPVASIDAGARYMKDLIAQYDGNVRAAIAHYNGGGRAGRAVMEGKAPPAKETQGYLARTDEYMGGRATDTAARHAVAADADVEAAARVRQTLDAIDSYRLTPAGDLPASTAHADAVARAHEQLAAGEPVNVTDLLNLDAVRTGRLLDDMIATGEAARADLLPAAGNLADPGAVRLLRAELDQLRAARPDDSAAAIKARAKELQDSEGLSYKRASTAAEKEMRQALAMHEAQITRVQGMLEQNAQAQQASEQLARVDRELQGLRAQRTELDAPASSPRQMAMAISDIFKPAPAPRVPQAARRAADTQQAGAPPRTEPPTAGAQPARQPGQAGEGAGGSPDAAAAQALDSTTTAALEANPDLMLQLEGMDAPMKASDVLAQIREEAAADVQRSRLVDVAANCFLRNQ
ncbi:transglycosylase SLT domain-containing protein [uncultured Pseudacidovorax sp.]|uniref:lytic transglycosylase domain-containing protein n=1 Tax=uncultured Pseudacidovorax sp. TaxID=679313 RepID=UPI0025DA0D4B|nr:transglycosylase SLT domain-containing protein [uncultured Pseudacidovorax sp.]